MDQPSILLLARANGQLADTPVIANALQAHDPFAGMRRTAFLGADGIAAGTVHASGIITVTDYPFCEMLVVHRGLVSLHSAHGSLVLGPGQSAVIGRASTLRIDAGSDSLWAFCAAPQATGPAKPGVSLLERYTPLTPSAAPEAAILLGPAPQCRAHTIVEDSSSPLRMGVWDSTPYARSARPHKVHELMHVLEGEVALHDAHGQRLLASPGDTLFVPQGTPCAWTSQVYVRKFYCVS